MHTSTIHKIHKNISHKKGMILVVTLLTLTTLVTLSYYIIGLTLNESKNAQSYENAGQAYYVADAAVREAIWKLSHDSSWIYNFETDPWCETWSDSFSKSNTLFEGSSYSVSITNTGCARGQIVATGTVNLGDNKFTQRIIKAEVFKAIGSPVNGIAIFSGSNNHADAIKIEESNVTVHNANIFSGGKIEITQGRVEATDATSTPELEGKILAVNDYEEQDSPIVIATEIRAENNPYTPAATSTLMPSIDFDSNDAASYKNQAITSGSFYTETEFRDLIQAVNEGGTLTLNDDVTYVDGDIKVRGNITLVVNGVLVSSSKIEIGKKGHWDEDWYDENHDSHHNEHDGHWQHDGNSQIIVNNIPGKASGLLAKKKIEFGKYSIPTPTTIEGLIYANDEVKFKGIIDNITVIGGIIGKKIEIEKIKKDLNVYLDNTILALTLGTSPYSPIVTIEYWEESY